MFLGPPDPDTLVRCMDLDPDPDPQVRCMDLDLDPDPELDPDPSIIKQK